MVFVSRLRQHKHIGDLVGELALWHFDCFWRDSHGFQCQVSAHMRALCFSHACALAQRGRQQPPAYPYFLAGGSKCHGASKVWGVLRQIRASSRNIVLTASITRMLLSCAPREHTGATSPQLRPPRSRG